MYNSVFYVHICILSQITKNYKKNYYALFIFGYKAIFLYFCKILCESIFIITDLHLQTQVALD